LDATNLQMIAQGKDLWHDGCKTEDKEFCQQGIEKHVQQSDKFLSSVGDSWKTAGKQ
jgi:hypothetical protein